MSDFWVNFLANLAADALLAIAVYLIVTQPGEKKKAIRIREQSLGLLKAEMQINETRAKSYIEALDNPRSDIAFLFPLRYTRGAWNALKETGFLASIDDPVLSYYLFRMNESTLVANKNLRKVQLAYLESTDENIELIAKAAKRDSEHLLSILTQILAMLDSVKIPEIAESDIFKYDRLPTSIEKMEEDAG